MIFFCVKGSENNPERWYSSLDKAMEDNPGKDHFLQVYAAIVPGQEYQRAQ